MTKKKKVQKISDEKQMIYKFEFAPGEVEIVLKSLYELPAKFSKNLIDKIINEGKVQEMEFNNKNKKPEPTPAPPLKKK